MSEFRAKIIAELDTNKIKGQIESLEKRIKSIDGKITLNLTGFNVETKKELNNLGNNITQTVQNSVATSANKSVNFVTKKLREGFTKEMSKVVGKRTFGLVDEKEIQKQAQSYFTTQNKVGTVTTEVFRNADSEINGFIVNVKNAEGAVERLRYGLEAIKDENGGQKIGVQYVFRGSTGNDNNIKLQEAAAKQAEKAEKALETQTQKNKAAVIQYTSALESLKSQYDDLNATKAIKKEEHIAGLAEQYGVVKTAITQLGSADEKTFATLKANVDAQITKLKDLVTQYKNSEYAANQLAAKPISVIKDNEALALKAFESKVKAAGITSKDFWNKINGSKNADGSENINSLKSKLNSVVDKNSLTEYLNLFSTIKAEFKALKAEQSGAKDKFNDLFNIAKRIGSLKVKISGLDAKKNSDEIVALSSEMKRLIQKYKDLKSELRGNLSSEQFDKLKEVVKTTKSEITVLKNKVKDVQAELAKGIKEKLGSNNVGIKSAIEEQQNRFQSLNAKMDIINAGENTQMLHSQLSEVQMDLQHLTSLEQQFANSGKMSNKELIALYKDYESTLSRVKNNLKSVNAVQKQYATSVEITTLKSRMELWLSKNTKAAKTYGQSIRQLINQLDDLHTKNGVLKSDFNTINNSFNTVKNSAKSAGLTGKTYLDSLTGAFKSISRYISASTLIYSTISTIKNGITTVVGLDTALVDLKKTTDATEEELKSFYYTANDTAKQLGVTTEDVINAASSWSRLGYSIKDAQTMAKTSSIFKSISPGMDMEQATDGLVSAMKAFDIEANDALDGIASKINAIGNTQAVSNTDIVEFLTRSSSAMKEANNTLDETIALGTAATEITRDASSVGKNSVADIKNGYIGQRIEVSETEERLYKYKLNTKGGEDMKKKRIVLTCSYFDKCA